MLGLILPTLGFAQSSCATAEEVFPDVLNTLDAYIGELATDLSCTEWGAQQNQANGNWYVYTANLSGVALITSDSEIFPGNAGLDTRLVVYTGTCDNLTCYESQDDVNFPDNNTSSLIMPIVAGQTYYIYWDDAWSDVAGFDWTIVEQAADCTTTIPYSTTFNDPINFYGCWNVVDLDANGTAWIPQELDLDNDGVLETFATNGSNGENPKNDWLFSPALTLEANQAYDISYSFNGANGQVNDANETITSYIVNAPNATFTFSQEIATNSGVIQNGDFADLQALATTASGVFVPATTGEYYLAFNATSPPNSAFLLLFDASVEPNLSSAEFDNTKVRVFPNPVASELSVVAPNGVESIEVFNMLGQRVAAQSFSSNDVRMNVAELTAGAYTVKVTSAGAVQTTKIVKQ